MNRKILKAVLILFIISIIFTSNITLAKENTVLELNTVYDECYTFEQLKEMGKLNTTVQEKNNNESISNLNISKSKILGASVGDVAQSEDRIYNKINNLYKNVYVNTDSNNDYAIQNNYGTNYKIYRHDIKNNTYEAIYTSKDAYKCLATYVRENVIYVEQAPYKETSEDYTEVEVLGFDVSTNQVVYEGEFAVPVIQGDYFKSFAVDSKQRFYFVYEYTGMRIFDNKGNLIYDKASEVVDDVQLQIVIRSITPNDEGIIYSLGSYNWQQYPYYLKTEYMGFQRLNNDGTFKQSEYTLILNETNTYYVEDSDWKFVDENGVYAVDQYGHIAKFDYTADNIAGVQITIFEDVLREIADSYTGYLSNPSYFIKDDYLYLLGSNNIIFVFDMTKDYERVGKITTGISEDYEVERITYINNNVYVKYTDSNYEVKERVLSYSIDNFKEIWYTEHINQERTKAQIIEKYKEISPKFDYTTDMFAVTPSFTSPYIAGKLKDGVVTDTLNQINYFRWLYGVNEVTVNTDKLERSQKGAVVQAANDELSHYPEQPADMDDEFYKEAYAACGASGAQGDWYNGNCAWGDTSPTDTIAGFINELNNISVGSYIGHRLNLLDLDVTQASFGYCNKYTALSMYYGDEENKNNEQFYAYPSAGYFPMQNFTTHEFWSFYCQENYNLQDLEIVFTYNGKTYSQENIGLERTSIVFRMPDELISEFGGAWNTMPEASINVQLTGMKDSNGDTINYKYDVTFFDINEVLINGLSFTKSEQTAYQGIKQKSQMPVISPSNATEDYEIVWSSSNEEVATIDENGEITCRTIGTTIITAKIGEYTASYTLNVEEAPEIQLGDINGDLEINARDAKLAIQYFTGKIELTTEQQARADVNKDGNINARDAKLIIQLFTGKITEF